MCFRILRDGGVADVATQRVRGDASFRRALVQAVRDAGHARAFGELPAAFDPATWRWCVELASL